MGAASPGVPGGRAPVGLTMGGRPAASIPDGTPRVSLHGLYRSRARTNRCQREIEPFVGGAGGAKRGFSLTLKWYACSIQSRWSTHASIQVNVVLCHRTLSIAIEGW